jgi:hypothetical protein
MPADYIPGADAAFDTWQTQFATYLNANLAALGLAPADPDVAALNAACGDWQAKYPAHIAAQNAAANARQAKDESRAGYETVVRRLVGRLQKSPAVDDGGRAALGITVPDREPTPVGPPTADLDECASLGTDTHSPYLAQFDGADADKTAHFIGR